MPNYYDYYEMTPVKEFLFNGQKIRYDACSTSTKQVSDEFYKKTFNYIASGYVYYINGVKTISDIEHHFYIKK